MTTTDINRPGKPVDVFTPGLVVKLARDVAYSTRSRSGRKTSRTIKAGAILVISAPWSTTETAGWSYTADGGAVALDGSEAVVWNFHD